MVFLSHECILRVQSYSVYLYFNNTISKYYSIYSMGEMWRKWESSEIIRNNNNKTSIDPIFWPPIQAKQNVRCWSMHQRIHYLFQIFFIFYLNLDNHFLFISHYFKDSCCLVYVFLVCLFLFVQCLFGMHTKKSYSFSRFRFEICFCFLFFCLP